MFKAVRDSFLGFGHRIGAAWQDLRSRGMVRLFLFEFAVVLLGVLAAQGLQSWLRERQADRQLAGAQEQFEEQAGQALLVAAIWDRGLPCLEQSVDEIIRSSGSRQGDLGDALERPAFMTADLDPLSDENALRLRHAVEPGEFYAMRSLTETTNRHKRIVEEIAGDWNYFRLIDPDFGPVSESDYAAARQAGARIRSNLEIVNFTVREMLGTGERLGLDLSSLQDQSGLRPAENCEVIRANRSMVARGSD